MRDCPYCSKELEKLGVIVRATQFLTSEFGYSGVEDIEETIGYYCPDCGSTLDFDQARELADWMIDEYEKSN